MKFVECPRCSEITLEIKDNGEATCELCGHYEIHTPIPRKRQEFDEWTLTVDLDKFYSMGKIEAMRVAFYAGISAQQDMEIARLRKQLDDMNPDDISLLKRQA